MTTQLARAVELSATPLSLITTQSAEPSATRGDGLAARYRTVTQAATNLAGATHTEILLQRVLRELCRCGFTRGWLTRINGQTLTISDIHTTHTLPTSLVERSTTLATNTYEAEIIRRRDAVLASDQEQMDPLVADTLRPQAYVAAPIVIDTRVIGVVSADRPTDTRPLTAVDHEVVRAFAIVASQAIHRTLLAHQLERLRDDVRQLTAQINTRNDQCCEELLSLPSTAADDEQPQPRQARLGNPGRIHELLTRRELEILRLIATGETNRTIATHLVISDGTVKSHVKNILRKLHATNRAAAISRYYTLTQTH